ncbi:MAG: nitroreductase family protein [Dehalococcoidia bacterium]|nr:nitroreductase family protein [Dehalococcoidia bacterium]
MDVMQAIKQRRSVRRYKPDPVKPEELQAVLEAARMAPSWANTQCWKFIVVRDSGTKAKLAATLSRNNPSTAAITEAPVVIAACAETGKAGFKRGEVCTDKGDWFMFDVGIAMQNLVLAAHSLGLGTVHVGLVDAKKAAEVLELPPGVVFVEMTPLGYPKEEPEVIPRKELSEIVFYEKYGQK